jgi:hypothetical protein
MPLTALILQIDGSKETDAVYQAISAGWGDALRFAFKTAWSPLSSST